MGNGPDVDSEHLFNGSALNAIDAKGRLSVPAIFRAQLELRVADKTLFIGRHETDPCLIAYDAVYNSMLAAEVRKRRARDEEKGVDLRAHFNRSRRASGFADPVSYDANGRILMPAPLRKLGQIEDLVLFVGSFDFIELWNPRLALESADADLRELAQMRLDERGGRK